MQPKIIEQISMPPAAGDTQQTMAFPTPVEQEVARITYEVVKNFERLPNSQCLKAPEIQEQILREVASIYAPKQGEMEGVVGKPNIPEIVAYRPQRVALKSVR